MSFTYEVDFISHHLVKRSLFGELGFHLVLCIQDERGLGLFLLQLEFILNEQEIFLWL